MEQPPDELPEMSQPIVDLAGSMIEQKQAGQDSYRLANYIRLLLESTDEGIYGLDVEGRCTLINRSAAKMFGYEPHELIGRELHPLMHHTQVDGRPYPQDDCPIFRAFRIGQGTRVDNEVFWRSDGTSFPVEYSSHPIIEEGAIRGAVVTFFDITERKLAEVALVKAQEQLGARVQERTAQLARANQELQVEIAERKRAEKEREQLLKEIDAQRVLFQTVVDKTPAGIAVLRGPDFVFELANPAYQSIAPGKALLGRTVADSWPELASQVVPLLEKVYRTGEPYGTVDTPFLIERSPGLPLEEVYLTFGYVPLHEPDGQVSAILVSVIETTEQVLARKRVEAFADVAQRRAAELQAVLDNMVDAVFVCDTEERITLANEAAMRMLGMDRPEVIKRTLSDFPELLQVRHQDGTPLTHDEQPLARALKGEIVTQNDQIIFNKKTLQDTYLRVSAAPIKEETGEIVGAVAVVRDVTGLMELDRLKDQFISTAAHELKTPLTLMKGYAQFLLRSTKNLRPPHRKALEGIDHGADRINSVVSDLLDISRLQRVELEMTMERIDLPILVEQVVDRMALTVTGQRIRVVKTEPAVVQGDRGRLEQILEHLIDNAVRFSPQGGDIDVAVSVREGEAVVSVRDHGVAIPKDRQTRIFERFYRAHARTPYDYGGLGVGLYIAKETIARQGGKMWFESEPGVGSTFYFSLPVSS